MIKLTLTNGIKQSLLYGGSVAIMKGVSLLMLPFIASHISTSEFGRLEVISTLAIIASILVGMGLEDTLFRFAGIEKSAKKRRKISAEIFSLTLLIASITLFTCWYIAPWVASIFPAPVSVYEIRLVLVVLALEGCIAIPLGWLRMNEKAAHFFFLSTGRALLQTLLVIVFLSMNKGVTGILEAGVIASVVQMLVLSYFQLTDTGLIFSLKTSKKAFIYSLPIVASGLIAFALNGMDRWILVEHVGLDEVAQFAIASKFALAMVLLMQPFGMWWSPRRFDVLSNSNGQQKVAKIIAMGCVLALLISVIVSLISPLLIVWLLPESYLEAAYYVVAVVIIMLLKELIELFNIGCFHGNTTSSQLIINLITGIIGIAVMLWLTPIYHVWGTIFALLLAQSIRLLLFYKISQHFLPLLYPTRSLLTFTLLSAAWIALGVQMNSTQPSILPTLSLSTLAFISLLLLAQYLGLINIISQFNKTVVKL